MPSPTAHLAQRLESRNLQVTTSGPIDPMVAMSDAPALCTQNRVDDLIVGRLELTRTSKFEAPVGVLGIFFRNAGSFAADAVGATTGLISASGVLQRTAIQARVHLYLIDCTGKLRWNTTTVAGEMHHGNNIGAGFTQIVERAIDQALTELMPHLVSP